MAKKKHAPAPRGRTASLVTQAALYYSQGVSPQLAIDLALEASLGHSGASERLAKIAWAALLKRNGIECRIQ